MSTELRSWSCEPGKQKDVEALTNSSVEVKDFEKFEDKKPQPGDAYSLGMFAFGMSTLLVGLHTVYESDSLGPIQGFLFGCVGQLIAGVAEYSQGNSVGGYIFSMFGLWWLGFCVTLDASSITDNYYPLLYNLCWLLFFLVNMGVFTAQGRKDLVGPITGATVCLVNIGFTILQYTSTEPARWFSGIMAIIAGLLGIYAGASRLLLRTYGRSILPIGLSS